MVCTSLSLASTSSLLVYLLYKKIKDYRAFGRHGTHYDNPTQGSFWLINLFVAGQFIYFELLRIRSRPRSRRYSCRSHRQSKFFNDWTWLHSSRIPHKLRRHCFSNLVVCNCVSHIRITCWRLQNQGLGSEKTASGKLRWVVCGGLWAFVFLIGAIGPVIIQPLNPGNGPYCISSSDFWPMKMIKLVPDGVGFPATTTWRDSSYTTVHALLRTPLIVVFLFIDMFALTVLYFILFVYLVVQSRKLRTSESTGDNQFSTHELPNWQANLKAGNVPPPPTGLKRIMTTQTVTVITETSNAAVRRVRTTEAISRRRMTQVATRLLCYPIVYICLTMPVSIARLAQVSGHNWGLTAIQVGAAIYVCSGWVNVLLYTATRKGIISWDWLAPRKRKAIRLSGTPRLSAIRVVPKPPSNMEATSIEKSLNDVSEWDFAQRDQDITPEELE